MYPVSMHGANQILYVNGKVYGVCESFSFASSTPHSEKRAVDITHPIELAPGGVSLTWQMSVIRTRGDGGLQGAGMSPNQVDAHLQKYITIELVDRYTRLTTFKSEFCVVDSESWGVAPKGRMLGAVSGKAILWTNEAG